MELSLVGEQTKITHGMEITSTALTFILACVCTQLWPTGFTIWSLVISLIMGESHLSMRGTVLNVRTSCDVFCSDWCDFCM